MAFKLLKLISKETLVADVYYIDDLLKFLKNTPEETELKGIGLAHKKIVVMIDPIEIVITKTESYSETSLQMYLPYSNDFYIPMDEDKIMTMTNPNEKILKAYQQYVRELKDKQEMSEVLKDKDMEPEEAEDLMKALLDLDPKKDKIN